MPLSFSDLTASFANHSIKHGANNKHPLSLHHHHQSRRSSSSSSSESTMSASSSSSGSTSPSPASPSSPANMMTPTLSSASSNDHTSTMIMMPPPSMDQLELVRDAWERVCERRLCQDHPSMSSAHAFGLAFYNTLFDLDTSLKFKFGNVIQQARVLAGIMSYLTRSPSIKGETGSLRDLNATKKSNSDTASTMTMTSKTLSVHSGGSDGHHLHDNDHGNGNGTHSSSSSSSSPPPSTLCATHAAAAAAAHAYNDLVVDKPRTSTSSLSRRPSSSVLPLRARPGPPRYHRKNGLPVATMEDEVCPFNQQEQEEKFQQQLLLQQEQQEEQERQRTVLQQDLQHQMQRKRMARYQEENQWFAYKLREVGIQHMEEYNLVPENLDVFEPALITALKSRLEEEFTPEVELAWNKVCTFTFHHMRIGMDGHLAFHRRARRLSSGSYCSIEAGETNGACTIQ